MSSRTSFIFVSSLIALGCGDPQPAGDTSETGSTTASTGAAETSGSSTTGPGGSSTGSETSSGGTSGGSSSSGGVNASTSTGGAPLGCEAEAVAPGEYLGLEVVSGGVNRNYNLYVPSSYDASTPTPLVLNFHGHGSNAAQQSFFSDFNVEAEEQGWIVAYPNGIGNSWNGGACCGEAAASDIDDVAFVRALVDQIADTMCLDATRVYAIGMSNGGFMSHRLACEAADIITAVGPVAGALVLPSEDCQPARPIPVIHFHGTADDVVPYAGNGGDYPGVEASLQGWADRNGCDPASSVTFEMDDVSCQSWDACEQDATVTLCALEGMNHCWPGQPFCPGGPSSVTIRANAMMIEFFEQYAL